MELLIIPLVWLAANGLHRLLLNHTARHATIPNATPATLQGDSGTAILFVHGFADTPEVFQLIAPRVHAQTGATCRMMCLPGFNIPWQRQRRATLMRWLMAVHRETRLLRKTHGRVFIAGHSLGGGLALLATRHAPRLADGLILFAPLVKPAAAWLPFISPEVGFRAASFCFLFSRAFISPFPKIIKTKDGRLFPYPRDRVIHFAAYNALFRMCRHLKKNPAVAASKPCHLPVLAFLSTRDRIVDSGSAAKWLEENFDTPKIVRTTEAGHVLPLDIGWEARADATAAFICPRMDQTTPLP